MDTENRGWGISGSALKMVAVISMLMDHIGATVLAQMLKTATPGHFAFVSAHWRMFRNLYTILRGVGRLAFPIYCFLIVEGFLHTRSVAKYAARLFVFALLSEIPFDLAINKSVWDMSLNNVYFTLLCGLGVIWGIRFASQRIVCVREDQSIIYGKLMLRSIVCAFFIFAGMALAEFVIKSDYKAAGILTIVVLYVLRSQRETAFLAAIVLLGVLVSELEFAAIPDILLIACYNGRRGRQKKLFFYAFYPVHLLVLSGICMLLGLRI